MRLKLQVAAAAALVLAWLLAFAGPGLRAWFTEDDLMNLYAAAHTPVAELLRSPVRPLGALVNRGLWEAFGFRPELYRAACFLLLGAGIALAAALARRLSASGGLALLFCVVFSFHAYLSDLYFNSGTTFELLCFLFYFGALFWYAGIRSQGRAPRWAEVAGMAALALLAMAAKEMAVTLPVMLAATEWLYGDRRHWRTTLLCAAACALMGWRAARYADPNPAYRMELTAAVFWARWLNYQRMLLYTNDAWTMAHARVFLAACALLPALVRRREAWWGAALMFAGPLPVLFVAERNFYAFYLPYLGACLLAASALYRLTRVAWPEGPAGPALMAVTLALWLAPRHEYMTGWTNRWYWAQEARLKAPGEALRRGLPRLAPGSKVLFLDDPFPPPPEDTTTVFYLVRMISGDPAIEVLRAKGGGPKAEDCRAECAGVFRLTQNSLLRVR